MTCTSFCHSRINAHLAILSSQQIKTSQAGDTQSKVYAVLLWQQYHLTADATPVNLYGLEDYFYYSWQYFHIFDYITYHALYHTVLGTLWYQWLAIKIDGSALHRRFRLNCCCIPSITLYIQGQLQITGPVGSTAHILLSKAQIKFKYWERIKKWPLVIQPRLSLISKKQTTF